MPELPEVETVRAGLARRLPGRTLRAIHFARADLRWPMPTGPLRRLAGRRCASIERRSKYLLLHFSGPGRPVALVHLGMSGRVFVEAAAPRRDAPPWRRHEHWRMDFGGCLVRFVDPRRFGVLDLVPEARLEQHRLLRALGPEPLDPAFDAGRLHARTRGRRVALKSFLMDARNVVGIGNIYASETCFRAGVRPRRRVARLTREECQRIVDAARSVLREAIAKGGTSLRDYVSVDESPGWFQLALRVYGRGGEPCTVCATPIRRVVDGARATFYCPRCQA